MYAFHKVACTGDLIETFDYSSDQSTRYNSITERWDSTEFLDSISGPFSAFTGNYPGGVVPSNMEANFDGASHDFGYLYNQPRARGISDPAQISSYLDSTSGDAYYSRFCPILFRGIIPLSSWLAAISILLRPASP